MGAFFYKLDTDVTVSQLFGGVGTSNGLAWSPDNTKMYYIDTPTRRVDVFDYDLDSGAISNRRPAYDLNWDGNLGGSPDGMTIDSLGNLWVATWGGSKVGAFKHSGILDSSMSGQSCIMLIYSTYTCRSSISTQSREF